MRRCSHGADDLSKAHEEVTKFNFFNYYFWKMFLM
jgi:hypothetical protein